MYTDTPRRPSDISQDQYDRMVDMMGNTPVGPLDNGTIRPVDLQLEALGLVRIDRDPWEDKSLGICITIWLTDAGVALITA